MMKVSGPVQNRSTDKRPGRHRAQEHEQVNLRALHGNAEMLDQVEGVKVPDAGQIEILGKNQHQQERQRENHLAHGHCGRHFCSARLRDGLLDVNRAVPTRHAHQQRNRRQRGDAEPQHSNLPSRLNDQRGQQRPDR